MMVTKEGPGKAVPRISKFAQGDVLGDDADACAAAFGNILRRVKPDETVAGIVIATLVLSPDGSGHFLVHSTRISEIERHKVRLLTDAAREIAACAEQEAQDARG